MCGFRVAPSRARGLKHICNPRAIWQRYRRALTGAWIETSRSAGQYRLYCVAPSRARGLKPSIVGGVGAFRGRALTGAWIETKIANRDFAHSAGRALTGAWIETIGRFAR